MKGLHSTRFILLHPSSLPTTKPTGVGAASPPHSPIFSTFLSAHHRVYLLLFLSFFTLASLLTLISTTSSHSHHMSPTLSLSSSPLPSHIFETLLHYASQANSTSRMPDQDLRSVANVLRRRGPCNLLVFGLGAETPLWRALNYGGRTVFLDENQYYVDHLEGRHPGLEAYDVSYTTQVRELNDLIADAREMRKTQCRPVQNLLFSDCRLGINDLPNELYGIKWDIILVDGPRGYSALAPGRMAAIFTAAVLARSTGNEKPVDVLVHDYDREVERVCSEEFLCMENMKEESGTQNLAHFVIRRGDSARRNEFCME